MITKAGMYKIEACKGEFIRKKTDSRRVYRVIGYCRSSRKWMLQDTEDCYGNYQYIKTGKLVYAGFEF